MIYTFCTQAVRGSNPSRACRAELGALLLHDRERRAVITGYSLDRDDAIRHSEMSRQFALGKPGAKDPMPAVRSYYVVADYFWTEGSKSKLAERLHIVTEGQPFMLARKGWYSFVGHFSARHAAEMEQASLCEPIVRQIFALGHTVSDFMPHLRPRLEIIARHLEG